MKLIRGRKEVSLMKLAQDLDVSFSAAKLLYERGLNDRKGIKIEATAEEVVGVARKFHEIYEKLALSYGYKTRKASAAPWGAVSLNNKKLMIATVRELLDWLRIQSEF